MPLIRSALRGSNDSGGALQLSSTSNATKGKIRFGTSMVFDEANARLGINVGDSPTDTVSLAGTVAITGTVALTGGMTVSGTMAAGIVTANKYGKPFAQRYTDSAGITNNNVTMVNVGMTATLPAGMKHEVRGMIIYSAAAAADLAVDFTGPAGYGCDLTLFGLGTTVTANPGVMTTSMVNASPAVGTLGGVGAGVKLTALVHGHLWSGDGGVVEMRARQVTSNAGATVIHTNSFLIYEAYDPAA